MFKANTCVFFERSLLKKLALHQNFNRKMDFRNGNAKKCLNNNSNIFCSKNHYMKKVDDCFFILNSSDFFDLYRHHKHFVQKRCDFVCPRDTACSLHAKLQRLEEYVDWLRRKNTNENVIIKKICLVFNADVAETRESFWWSDVLEWEEGNVPPDVTLRWRAQFL